MKIDIYNLVIEVTRKCNLQCDHCLRGKAQNKDMPKEYIDSLLSQVESIGNITFTGGEPSLNTPIIKYFLEKCKELNIPISDFYIATNGINISTEFILFCLELYAYCDEKEMCSIVISNDYYHSIEGSYNDILLKGLIFFNKKYENDNYNYPYNDIINEGNAKEFGLGKHRLKVRRVDTKESFNEETVYLNCNGYILADCDLSYESQNKHKLCKVEDLTDFYDKLKGEDEELICEVMNNFN